MSSPFIIPPGNVQIAFSGGRTSGMMLHHILEANGALPSRAKIIFTNTGREMPETLDFVQECGERWGVPIVWAEYRFPHQYEIVSHNSASQDGEPLIDIMRKFEVCANRMARFCSTQCKERTAKRYLMDCGWEHWAVALGIRADEGGRIAKKPPRDRFVFWYPMFAAGLSKRDVSTFWKRQPFNLRLLDLNGKTPLGNCDGCFLKSEANRAALARDYPERAQWWADQEARFRGTFLPDQSWQKTIDTVRSQGDWIFNTKGYLCQADGGDCTGYEDTQTEER